MVKAHVYVTMRRGVLEPQGRAVQKSLENLGYTQVKGVRIGKFIEVELDGVSRQEAENILEEICRKLLANPVIEDFRFEIVEE
ncbi:MAG: phosphoribosylformylglycinamidine synthase subunit PurS [Deltaproteobacteria bacterium]|nr:MAG: phosphoribosylformylglycinamidine synthase subunit PurS [Deltaproteobacteria bacterium]